MGSQEKRAARNELLFRAVNEQIVELTERFRTQLADLDLVCECPSGSCTGTVRVEIDELSQMDRTDGLFLVIPGHEDETIEDVVSKNGRFVVVRKRESTLDAVR